MKAVTMEDVLVTYRCLISCREEMPGMRLEDAFDSQALEDIRAEYYWLEEQARHQAKTPEVKA